MANTQQSKPSNAAIAFGALLTNNRDLSVEWAGQKVEFTYNVAAVTPAFADWLVAENGKRGSLIEAITRTVVGWQITGNDGKLLPVSKDVIDGNHPGTAGAAFPTGLLQLMLEEVLDDFGLGKWKPGAVSDVGSSDQK